MGNVGVFPFGEPVRTLVQSDRSAKRVFVLGVYASAVHARWVDDKERQRISAVAVASEPEIFWRGNPDEARDIVARIKLPAGSGRLIAAGKQLNGPSGRALDELFLTPLGLTRDDAWLCDLVPHSCRNEKQKAALEREYDGERVRLGLPAYDWPPLPTELANAERRASIESELKESGADIVITLGDQPLEWFTKYYGSESKLAAYGKGPLEYGQLHSLTVAGRSRHLLPLVHPRQADRLGSHSAEWFATHETWTQPQHAGKLLI